jgi:secondary thiamine-phosphate synthase enzyme
MHARSATFGGGRATEIVHHHELRFSTRGDGDMHDVTAGVAEAVRDSGIADGIVTVFASGSTCAITTIEFEPGLRRDFPAAMERLAPRDLPYAHDQTWHDGNGHAHVRASLIGPSVTVPVSGGKPLLGTWQQIVFLDFDNRPRQRQVTVTVIGD